MTFTFSPAERRNTHIMVALAGASGTGKTYSAMRLASGICGDKPFAVIDTEAGRALHYADQFRFDHVDFGPPFSPERYTEAVKAAVGAGYDAIVIDSMSHEFEGQGGLMEAAEQSNMKGPGAWLKPKQRHKKMMNEFLQVRSHLIFCLRAAEKIDMSKKDEKGRVIVESKGWVPIQEKTFMYEMTASLTLSPDHPGIVDMTLPHKMQDQHRMAFMPGRHITEEAGLHLARWARGEPVETPHKDLWDRARTIAHEGRDHLLTFWKEVATDEEKQNLRVIAHELKQIAADADANRGAL